jgi:hypothetical protein
VDTDVDAIHCFFHIRNTLLSVNHGSNVVPLMAAQLLSADLRICLICSSKPKHTLYPKHRLHDSDLRPISLSTSRGPRNGDYQQQRAPFQLDCYNFESSRIVEAPTVQSEVFYCLLLFRVKYYCATKIGFLQVTSRTWSFKQSNKKRFGRRSIYGCEILITETHHVL